MQVSLNRYFFSNNIDYGCSQSPNSFQVGPCNALPSQDDSLSILEYSKTFSAAARFWICVEENRHLHSLLCALVLGSVWCNVFVSTYRLRKLSLLGTSTKNAYKSTPTLHSYSKFRFMRNCGLPNSCHNVFMNLSWRYAFFWFPIVGHSFLQVDRIFG